MTSFAVIVFPLAFRERTWLSCPSPIAMCLLVLHVHVYNMAMILDSFEMAKLTAALSLGPVNIDRKIFRRGPFFNPDFRKSEEPNACVPMRGSKSGAKAAQVARRLSGASPFGLSIQAATQGSAKGTRTEGLTRAPMSSREHNAFTSQTNQVPGQLREASIACHRATTTSSSAQRTRMTWESNRQMQNGARKEEAYTLY